MKRRYKGMLMVGGTAYGMLLCIVVGMYAKKMVAEQTPLLDTSTYQDRDFVSTSQNPLMQVNVSGGVSVESLPLEKQLMRAALRHAPPGTVKAVLDKAAVVYKNDKPGYVKFIMTQDQDGWTVLQHYIVDGDIPHVAYILDRVSKFFKDDPDKFATFIMLHDKQGQSPLYMSLKQHQFVIAEMLINAAEKAFGNDKLSFFKFLNKHEYSTGKTALIFAAYNAGGIGHNHWLDAVSLLVETAARVLGQNSSYFKRFINAKDSYGRTAVTYGNNQVDAILEPYGGTGEEFKGEVS